MEAFLEKWGSDRAFRLYATCKLVEGGKYSAVYDLDRRILFRFDTRYYALFELCGEPNGLRLCDLEALEPDPRMRALEALVFLWEREVGCFVEPASAEYLAPLSDRWSSPHDIINSIVDIDETLPDWEVLITELDALHCRGLQVRAFSALVTPAVMTRILEILQGTGIARVDMLVKWSTAWDDLAWPEIFQRYRNLLMVRVHAAPYERSIDESSSPAMLGRWVSYQAAAIENASHCGMISERNLSPPTARLFGELKRFNGCLNRKVSLRADGQVCNCPSMRKGFGNDLRRLRQIVSSPEFRRPWSLNKDSINVCRGCEYRYVCTDCRAYLGDDLSREKPVGCAYDPVTGRWGDAARAEPGAPVLAAAASSPLRP